MPKYIILRTETIERRLVLEAKDEHEAYTLGRRLDWDAFHEDDVSSETDVCGEADENDIKFYPNLTAEEARESID